MARESYFLFRQLLTPMLLAQFTYKISKVNPSFSEDNNNIPRVSRKFGKKYKKQTKTVMYLHNNVFEPNIRRDPPKYSNTMQQK